MYAARRCAVCDLSAANSDFICRPIYALLCWRQHHTFLCLPFILPNLSTICQRSRNLCVQPYYWLLQYGNLILGLRCHPVVVILNCRHFLTLNVWNATAAAYTWGPLGSCNFSCVKHKTRNTKRDKELSPLYYGSVFACQANLKRQLSVFIFHAFLLYDCRIVCNHYSLVWEHEGKICIIFAFRSSYI